MSVILIASAFLLFAFFYFSRPRNGIGSSLLKGSLTVYLVVFMATEVLSRFDAIAFWPLVAIWCLANVVAIVLLAYNIRRSKGLRRLKRKASFVRRMPGLNWREAVFATIIVLIALPVLFSAAKEYPYDADSIGYHMPRVANWINRGSVEFYTNTNQRQNFYSPGATYLILHIQLLSGCDKLAIVPQAFSFFLCLALAGMLALKLGLGRAGALFAAVLTATIPIFIAQAHCNQNELVFGATILGFAWFLLVMGRRRRWSAAVWCGLTFGLALLTKGTAFIFCAAIGPALGICGMVAGGRNWRIWLKLGFQLATAVLIGLAIKTPFIIRCNFHGKTYLDNEYTSELRNTRKGLDVIHANVVRNFAAHLGMQDQEWNTRIETWVRKRVGEQDKNIESSFRSLPFKMQPAITCFYARNPLHLVLVFLAWLCIPLIKGGPWSKTAAWLIASVLMALLFNLLLKYQYWGIRLQLAWLLFTVPLIALVLFRLRLPQRLRAGVQVVVALGLFLAALPALLCDSDIPILRTNNKAPLVFRDAESIRFGSRFTKPGVKNHYVQVAEFVMKHEPEEIGLIVPRCNASFDYNWWVVFGNHARPGKPMIRYLGPNAWPEPKGTPPEWVVVRDHKFREKTIMGVKYKQAFRAGACRVYQRVGDAKQPAMP